jgi:dolichyl-phosphate-mannose--protein O-mannosyl transferase
MKAHPIVNFFCFMSLIRLRNLYVKKGLWCFERLSRRKAGPVLWDTAVRLRHVASGRYLAVDTHKPTTDDSGHKRWFPTYMVDDEALELDDFKTAADVCGRITK